MDLMNEAFNRLDFWRHFPGYQLERRADVFFALYLSEVLGKKFCCSMDSRLIPEFPVPTSAGTKTKQSNRIDYVALSKQHDKVFFVELKTDMRSRRVGQDTYLQDANRIGLQKLVERLIQLFESTTDARRKRKYFCLLEYLESMELLYIPPSLKNIMSQETMRGANEASKLIKVTVKRTKSYIVYVQPVPSDPCESSQNPEPAIVTFANFAETVREREDPVSRRFAESLDRWISWGNFVIQQAE